MNSIHALLHEGAFDPETVQVVVQAFESCRETIPETVDRPLMEELMAKRILQLARRGIRDPRRPSGAACAGSYRRLVRKFGAFR